MLHCSADRARETSRASSTCCGGPVQVSAAGQSQTSPMTRPAAATAAVTQHYLTDVLQQGFLATNMLWQPGPASKPVYSQAQRDRKTADQLYVLLSQLALVRAKCAQLQQQPIHNHATQQHHTHTGNCNICSIMGLIMQVPQAASSVNRYIRLC